MLARPELRQLAQRITARYQLTPLDAKETADYLRHRWRVAGGQKFPFDAKAVQRLHQRSCGIPRLLNVIAERALLADLLEDSQKRYNDDPSAADQLAAVGQKNVPAGVDRVELAAWTSVARAVFNLSETITRN